MTMQVIEQIIDGLGSIEPLGWWAIAIYFFVGVHALRLKMRVLSFGIFSSSILFLSLQALTAGSFEYSYLWAIFDISIGVFLLCLSTKLYNVKKRVDKLVENKEEIARTVQTCFIKKK